MSDAPARALRVLDLTDDLARQAGRLLVGLGADVLRVVAPGRHHDTEAERLHWHAGQRVLELDPDDHHGLAELARPADVVIESGPLRALRGVHDVNGQAVSRFAPMIHVVVTPFGLTGPRRDWQADDLVVTAAGGMAWLGGYADGQPKPPPREQAGQLAGTHAAIAALLAVIAGDRDGMGQLVDISAQEAVASTLETAAISWIHAGRYPSRNGGVYEHVAHRIFPAQDGYLAGGYSGSDRMWTSLLDWMVEAGEAGDLADERWSDPVTRWQGRAHVDELVAAFAARRPAEEMAASARARGLPWAVVATPAQVLVNPQLQARAFFDEIATDTADRDATPGIRDVGPPFPGRTRSQLTGPRPVARADAWRPAQAPRRPAMPIRQGEARDGALAGLRVLDLTWVLAGPYATKMLAEHGADVIKIESRHRQDPTRFSPGMRLRPGAGPDESGYFLNFNRNKRSVALNLRTERGQHLLRRLADKCDVVIDNYRPGVLARWGMGAADLLARNPNMIVVSMSGVGSDGPWRDCVTFADTLAAMSGLSYETRDPGGPPQGLTFGLGDMVAADAAVLAILDHVVTGRGGYVDLSQLEAMTNSMGAAMLEASLGKPRETNASATWPNRHPVFVPQGLYPTRGDDRWIALSIGDDASWRALVELVDCSDLRPLAAADAGERRANEDVIDDVLTRWAAPHDGADLVRRLQAAGIPAAVVNTGQDLVETDEQLAARGFYPLLDHPLTGPVRHEGIVARLQRTPGTLRTAAPLLGHDTDAVLHDLLAIDGGDLAQLRDEGVLE